MRIVKELNIEKMLKELENIIQALYELSDTDMSRIETYHEAIERVKQLFLTNSNDNKNIEFYNSITKNKFLPNPFPYDFLSLSLSLSPRLTIQRISNQIGTKMA